MMEPQNNNALRKSVDGIKRINEELKFVITIMKERASENRLKSRNK